MASRMRTGLCSGSVWNAALIRSRSFGVHAAVHRQQAVVAREPLGGQDRLEPVLRGPVLGEDDDPVVRPLAAGPDVLVEPVDQLLGLGVELGRLARSAQVFISFSRAASSVRRLAEQQAGGVDGIVGRLFRPRRRSAYSSSTRSIWR